MPPSAAVECETLAERDPIIGVERFGAVWSEAGASVRVADAGTPVATGDQAGIGR